MATLTISIPAGSETGAILRRLGQAIQLQAGNVPDKCGSGAATVLTIDSAPATGTCSVQLTSGPYTNPTALIV